MFGSAYQKWIFQYFDTTLLVRTPLPQKTTKSKKTNFFLFVGLTAMPTMKNMKKNPRSLIKQATSCKENKQ